MNASADSRLDAPPAWEAAAEEILERARCIVLAIGASGVGKSSFCRYLAEALAQKEDVAIVDADIGQSNLGPPATVSLAYAHAPVDVSALSPAAHFFVGSTNPLGRLLPLVIGTANLAREARTPFVIIDTTGLIHETGRVLKNYKIEAVRPDVIVAIERRNELAPIRAANRHAHIIRLKPSRAARPKDDYQKIELRARLRATFRQCKPRGTAVGYARFPAHAAFLRQADRSGGRAARRADGRRPSDRRRIGAGARRQQGVARRLRT